MKKQTIIKSFILLTVVFCGSMAVRAADPGLSDMEISRDGDNARVTFRLSVPRGVVKSGYAMALQPVITDGTHSVSLQPVVIRGRRAEMLDSRYRWVSGQNSDDSVEPVYMRPKTTIYYSDAVPFQLWMGGAELRMENLTWGCCDSKVGDMQILARNLLQDLPEPGAGQPAAAPSAPKTTGDMLALTFPFVVSEADYVPGEPIFDDDRENAIIVYYRQGNSRLEPDFSTNRLMLTNISAAIQTIAASKDSHVSRIVLAGFASPEGLYRNNDRLAWERAVSVKEYIMKYSAIPNSDIVIYNGSEDWPGLRMMVETSAMPDVEKRQVLDIIANVPVLSSDGVGRPRREMLQMLNGGRTYRYMYENFFPKLRSGAFIRVYYKNTEQ